MAVELIAESRIGGSVQSLSDRPGCGEVALRRHFVITRNKASLGSWDARGQR